MSGTESGAVRAQYNTNSEIETEALAAQLAQTLRAGDVLAFRGGLGMGKTAFVRGLAAGLGIRSEVSSPSFALVHEYHGTGLSLYHFDMYRVEDWTALDSTGFFDYGEAGGILAVEWSENIENALPQDAIFITIEATGENSRRILWERGEQ